MNQLGMTGGKKAMGNTGGMSQGYGPSMGAGMYGTKNSMQTTGMSQKPGNSLYGGMSNQMNSFQQSRPMTGMSNTQQPPMYGGQSQGMYGQSAMGGLGRAYGQNQGSSDSYDYDDQLDYMDGMGIGAGGKPGINYDDGDFDDDEEDDDD